MTGLLNCTCITRYSGLILGCMKTCISTIMILMALCAACIVLTGCETIKQCFGFSKYPVGAKMTVPL